MYDVCSSGQVRRQQYPVGSHTAATKHFLDRPPVVPFQHSAQPSVPRQGTDETLAPTVKEGDPGGKVPRYHARFATALWY